MTCPPAIARVVLEILQLAVLKIRAGGWGGDAARCAVEADHVHNLPALLIDYSADLLQFYWQVERPSFVKRSKPEDLQCYESLWAELAELVPSAAGPLDREGGERSREPGGPTSRILSTPGSPG
jgi:hypothetical protein